MTDSQLQEEIAEFRQIYGVQFGQQYFTDIYHAMLSGGFHRLKYHHKMELLYYMQRLERLIAAVTVWPEKKPEGSEN